MSIDQQSSNTERRIKRTPATGREFQAREAELEQLRDWFQSEKSIFIHAAPRSGKTSLLRKLDSEGDGSFINASSFNPDWSMEETITKFRKQFKEGRDVVLVDEADSAFRNSHFMEMMSILHNQGFVIVWSAVQNEEVPAEYADLAATKTLDLEPFYPAEMWNTPVRE